MTTYYEIKEGVITAFNTQSCRPHWQNCNMTEESIEITPFGLMLHSEWEIKKEAEEYKQAKAQEEAKRIAMLHLTRGDVFRALLKAKGVTRTQLRTAIETNETLSDVERELALIDFDEALEFYRGVDLINILGASLGITKEQLDEFFETNDYTKLLPPAVEEPVVEPVESEEK